MGAIALAVAELIAGIRRDWRSPVLDVGDRVIDRVPVFLKEFAIETFGTNDKPALLIGIGTILAVFAAMVVGIVGLRRDLRIGLAGVAALSLVGAWAAATRREGGAWHVAVPSLAGGFVASGALVLIARRLARPMPDLSVEVLSTRRQFIGRTGTLVAGMAVTAGPLAALGRRLAARFTAGESRRAVVLPPAVDPLPPLAAGTDLGVTGLSSFITPNASFYRIDTALVAPQVPTEGYTLRVKGLVERELVLTYDELLARPLIERDITLTCVSNQVGGQYVGTARWLGCRLDDLLAEAGIDPGADQVVGRSVDGYTCGFPVDVVDDGRDALVAVGMNGEPLPIAHGFPVRLVVPGLYGYLSATKWLTEIELTTFDAFDHYWVPRGYAAKAPIKLASRIDTPRGLAKVAAGMVPVAGVAWEQTVGIEAVEVSIDGGPWQLADLGRVPSNDTWVQWRFRWDAEPGRHDVTVRAIDRNGVVQTADRSEPLPDGATGLHTIVVIAK